MERRRGACRSFAAPETPIRCGPLFPQFLGCGMDRRSQRQHVDHHAFVVADPVGVDQTAFGMPTHGDWRAGRRSGRNSSRRAHRAQPRASGSRARPHRLDRNIAPAKSTPRSRIVVSTLDSSTSYERTGLHVEEVIEEALVASRPAALRPLRRIPEKPQGRQREIARFLARAPAAFDADGIGRKRKPHRGDAAEGRRWPAVRHQAVRAVHRFPEEPERPLLDLVVEGGEGVRG